MPQVEGVVHTRTPGAALRPTCRTPALRGNGDDKLGDGGGRRRRVEAGLSSDHPERVRLTTPEDGTALGRPFVAVGSLRD